MKSVKRAYLHFALCCLCSYISFEFFQTFKKQYTYCRKEPGVKVAQIPLCSQKIWQEIAERRSTFFSISVFTQHSNKCIDNLKEINNYFQIHIQCNLYGILHNKSYILKNLKMKFLSVTYTSK